jgi:hypothetical protein
MNAVENNVVDINSNLKPLVDQIGRLRAQIAELSEMDAKLVKELQNAGVEVLEGNFFRVVLSSIKESVGPDWKKIAMKLKPSRQLITANQRVNRVAHVRVNVSVRKGVI